MRILALVAVGGAIGSVARHLLVAATARALPSGFPAGTLLVNVAGSALMGLIAVMIVTRFSNDPTLRAFLLTGILGGFTTFSAFSLDAVGLFERGETSSAIMYVAASVVLSLLAFAGGAALARMVTA